MNIEEIASSMLNGDPVHDGIVVGIIFICLFTFYNCIFSAMFCVFKR